MKKKILVIGSNSFSGASFINFALSKNLKIVGVSRSKENKNYFLQYYFSKNKKNFKFYKIDINQDLSKLLKIIKNFKPQFIINFAAQSMVAESWYKPLHWYQTNVISQIKLIENIKKYKFIKKFINFTTPEVYGSQSNWQSEHYNFRPSTPYAISRAATDQHLLSMFKYFKFPVIFTRAANIYGPGQQLYRIIPKTIMYSLLRKKMSLHGGGKSKRSFIYMDDVSEAVYKILLKGKAGETYHISGKKLISIKNLVKIIYKICDKVFDNKIIISNERVGKDLYYKLNSSKIRRKLHWKDNTSLNKGIKNTLDWIIKNFKNLNRENFEYIHKK
jgi:dTDP-glucose 4,6-dehydratase